MSPQIQTSPATDRGPTTIRSTANSKNLSFAERAAKKPESSAPTPQLVNGNKHMRDIDRPLPGDVRQPRKARSRVDLAKQRSNINFFEEAFAVTETNHEKERIYGDSMVLAEVKTNVIIEDEFSFITELSYHLSTRYQRPVTSIAVTLRHSACMMYGGSVDPAYIMSIFALPLFLQPTTNKRNAALIQRHMEDVLGVNPSRGLLRFVPTNDEHLASNSNTVAGQVEETEKSQGHSSSAGGDEGSSGLFRRTSLKLSVKSFSSFRQPPHSPSGPLTQPELTPPGSASGALPTVPESPASPTARPDKDQPQQKRHAEKQQAGPEPRLIPSLLQTSASTPAAQQKQARRKKSFVAAMFGRSGTTTTAKAAYRNSLPNISGD